MAQGREDWGELGTWGVWEGWEAGGWGELGVGENWGLGEFGELGRLVGAWHIKKHHIQAGTRHLRVSHPCN